MDLSHQLNPSYSPTASHQSTFPTHQDTEFPSPVEGAPRKRRAVGFSPPGFENVSDHWESISRSSTRASDGSSTFYSQEQIRSGAVSWEAHIPKILNRLAKVEDELAMLKTPPKTVMDVSELASMRSILSPALQGSSDPRAQIQFASHDGTTPIYSEQERQLGTNFMDSLSLRRDLLSPENPPFGMWWTYTVEETLVWPILEFKGEVNSGLDALLDLPDEEEEAAEVDDGLGHNHSSLGPKYVGRAKRGLDDGDTVHELVENFLGNIHAQNPVLDPTQLRVHATNLVENGLGWDGETCQVLLACALGAVSYPWNLTELEDCSGPKTHPERYSMGREYFKAAQKRLGALWSGSSLISTQCLFMTGIYFMYTLQPVAGWRAFNSATIACRSYISKSVARRNKSVPRPDTRNLEQRLCWSCIKSEREITCEFGMETSGLNQLAYSTTLPTPPNGFASEIHNISAISPPSQTRPQEDESWYYFLTEIMLRKLQMRIDIFYQDKRREAYRRAGESAESFFQTMAEALQEFDFQLTSYYQNLPPVMQFSLEDLAPCSDELRHYLRWRVFCVRHDVTLPALYILLHNDVSRWATGLVAELVQLANTCLMLDVKILRNAITTYRHQTTWLCLRTAVRSALILIAAERLAARQLPYLKSLFVPDRATWEDGAHTLMERLQYWSRESKDCSAYVEMLCQLHPTFREISRRN